MGVIEGRVEGITGFVVGNLVGLGDGRALGRKEGSVDETALGLAEASNDGSRVGVTVSVAVGDWEGLLSIAKADRVMLGIQ
mmetsp:Transcript_8549/g.12691  ORF Transcript_8549/g.12691 Transcript_8549/m.12691 type:complete len:81 (-) Transcript_8549:112-354(-)